jgi:hypothetical protein
MTQSEPINYNLDGKRFAGIAIPSGYEFYQKL